MSDDSSRDDVEAVFGRLLKFKLRQQGGSNPPSDSEPTEDEMYRNLFEHVFRRELRLLTFNDQVINVARERSHGEPILLEQLGEVEQANAIHRRHVEILLRLTEHLTFSLTSLEARLAIDDIARDLDPTRPSA